VSPFNTRSFFIDKIQNEIKHLKAKQPAAFILKLNSFSDEKLIEEIYHAAKAGVDFQLIIRGICGVHTENSKWKSNIRAISIVDEYLEHARIMYFNNKNKNDYYISSADWMIRNIDYRIEVTTPIFDPTIKEELKEILDIQLKENVKARMLDNEQANKYVQRSANEPMIRSQEEIYHLLKNKSYTQSLK
jgi:polyphosphate kinase